MPLNAAAGRQTARPQPSAINRAPAALNPELFSVTLAQTPSPNNTSKMVPTNSPIITLVILIPPIQLMFPIKYTSADLNITLIGVFVFLHCKNYVRICHISYDIFSFFYLTIPFSWAILHYFSNYSYLSFRYFI